MITYASIRKPVDHIEGLRQQILQSRSMPFPQDWIVTELAHEKSKGVYWLSIINLNRQGDDQKQFYAVHANRPLDWRYKFADDCKLFLLRHETDTERRLRETTGQLAEY